MCVLGTELCTPSPSSAPPVPLIQVHAPQRKRGAIPAQQSLGTPDADAVSAGKPGLPDCRQLLEEFLADLWREQLVDGCKRRTTYRSCQQHIRLFVFERCLFIFEREKECGAHWSWGGAEREEGQRIQSGLCADSREPDAGLGLINLKIMT